MGETLELFRPSFDHSVVAEARESNQSSDAGLLPVREVLERSGLFDFFDGHLFDPRGQSVRSCILPVEQKTRPDTRHPQIYSISTGYCMAGG